ncbi:MAG: M28 family peptidase [Bacteroidales bacterium]|nr:M28 family peptidase [Bacteroidales bacterium]
MKNLLLIILTLSFFILSSCEQQGKTKKAKPKAKKAVVVPAFNADSAYAFVQRQVDFGPRVPGTPAHQACANWLAEKLQVYGDTVIIQAFRARTYDMVARNGKNLVASFSPEKKKRVLLLSHWDSRPFADHDPDPAKHRTPIDAANDGASGVGILLEMARQFHLRQPDVGVDIVLFDLEDWGPPTDLNMYKEEYWGLGAQYWSKNPHVYGYTATFGILLDMVGAKDAVFPKEYYSRQYARYVVDLVWYTALKLGYGSTFLNQDGGGATDDHVFVNRIANIPTIDIIHLDTESANHSFFEHWHTTSDNMDQIDKKTLGIVGEVLMSVVYNED